MYVCVCNAVTEKQVRQSVAQGATTLEDLQIELGVGSCCGTCSEVAATYLNDANTEVPMAITQVVYQPTVPQTVVPAVVAQPRLSPLAEAPPVRWVARGPRRAGTAVARTA